MATVKPVRSLQRGLKLLSIMSSHKQPMTIKTLCEESGLSMPTVYRLVQTMLQDGYLEYISETKEYRVGLKLVSMAGAALAGRSLLADVQPLLEQLVQECGETASLTVFDWPDVVYVAQAECQQTVKMAARLGHRLPPHCTASGKLFLAEMPVKDLWEFCQTVGLERYTEHTITHFDALCQHLSQIAQNGYSVDNEEREMGVRCLAVPVRNSQGKMLAALSISGPSSRITLQDTERHLPHLRECAKKIGEHLAFAERI